MRNLGRILLFISIFKMAVIAHGQSEDITIDSFSAYAGQTNIILQAGDDVVFSGGTLTLPVLPAGFSGQLTVQAGNNIIVDTGTTIAGGAGWTITMMAGTNFSGTTAPTSGSDGIYLDGNSTQGSAIQTQNGNINLWAANEVQVGWSGSSAGSGLVNSGSSSVTTVDGGNVSVTAVYGDVNTGSDPSGFDYHAAAPYCTVDASLGGISTADGGNVTINAGGNVISHSSTAADGGTGAFGSAPGNVTINAGGNVFGHYVTANGTGAITAGQNAGGAAASDSFAISLISGSWNVSAPNGRIYLQEVRNPNGVFNSVTGLRGASPGKFLFNYAQQASVNLTANGVYLTDLYVPRLTTGPVPVLYPPILNITAGSGGVTLEGDVTLFPSPDQYLDITVTNGGNFTATAGVTGLDTLLMSDSAQTQWQSTSTFSATDHGSLANEPIDSSSPVLINISGNMENLNLITTKATDITVGGSMTNCSFSGQNLQSSDVTSINVAGQIYNTSSYSIVTLGQGILNIPAGDLLPSETTAWNDIFTLAVNPSALASLVIPPGTPPSLWATYILEQAGLFSNGANPGFIYDPTTAQFGFAGPMSASLMQEMSQPITILHLVNGVPVQNPATGQFETDTITWAPASAIQTLYTESQGNSPSSEFQLGYRVGGPGEFEATANSISFGNGGGILSCGIYDPAGGFNRYSNLASITPVGATVDVMVSSNLDMVTSTIASLDGSDVNVASTTGSMDLGLPELLNATGPNLAFGIYSTGGGNVSVTADGDVDIAGSCVATYDGGNIFVESLTGNVDAGNGSAGLNAIYSVYSGESSPYEEVVYGSGIIAETLAPPTAGEAFPPNAATVPGNITVETPEGNIINLSAGILQESLSGNLPAGPIITLIAGTVPSFTSPGYPGNIVLGSGVVISGNAYFSANGFIGDPPLNTSINQSAGGFVISWNASDAQFDPALASAFEIESSPDLVNWQVINPNITPTANGGLSFESPASTNSSCFYRIQWQ